MKRYSIPILFALAAAGLSAFGKVDVLCIYYPEWHVYPEGDVIFGKGRTEWDFVNTAVPRFTGHEQPIRLVDGNPDDSNPADVAKEIDYAADAGIDVFVYDWYWADHKPIQHEALEGGFLKAPNRGRMKFALMWANHNRSDVFRSAPGKCNDRFFWKLRYDRDEFLEAIDYCIRAYFGSPQYYRKDGRLFLSIYSAMQLVEGLGGPEAAKTVFAEAQKRVKDAGLPPLHLSAMIHGKEQADVVNAAGFDSTAAYNVTPYDFDDSEIREEKGETRQLYSHEEFAELHGPFNRKLAGFSKPPYIPVAARGWDASPRCRNDEPFPWKTLMYPYLGIVRDTDPKWFRRSLEIAKAQALADPKKPGAILINAWNEYTEGCYLMPDKKNGDAYLRAVKSVFAAGVGAALPICAGPIDASGPAGVTAVGDAICTVSDSVAMSNGIAIVDYVLKPEAGSNIRCRMSLPPPEKWNGEFWGLGNSSFGGVLPGTYGLSMAMGAAVATTDLGTSAYISGDGRKKDVPSAVLRDYAWRATHLMTVYGKRIVKAFYGREARHAYFSGGSCGGRQGLIEAMRFPSDYDGILSSIPAAVPTVSSAQLLNLYRQTHDSAGKALFTRKQLRVVADAPIEYMKDRDPKPYAGKVLANPFLPERDIEGFLALAAKKDPSLADPDLQQRLKNIFMGVSRNGKTVCHGMLPGAFFGFKKGRNFEDKGGSLMTLRYRRLGFGKVATWEEYEEEVARSGSTLNACSTDLSAFRDRGGKLMVLCGWEDQTTPSPETVAWYEMLAERNGGYDKTGAFCRLFALPGHAHGGGKGRISTAGGYTIKHLDLLRKWVEDGKVPETYPQLWKEMNLTLPIPPYPFMCYQDEGGNWKTKRYPEGMVRRPDPAYMPCY